MAEKFDDLLAEVMRLSAQDRERLLAALKESIASAANTARSSTAAHAETDADAIKGKAMTHVTVALPENLAQQAQDAGLLAGNALEKLIRRALHQKYPHLEAGIPAGQRRRLVEKNGYLVVESLPGEKPITTEEVRKILDDMERQCFSWM